MTDELCLQSDRVCTHQQQQQHGFGTIKRAFRPSTATPVTTGATTETVALYRKLIDMGRRQSFYVGANDLLAGSVATYPSPVFYRNNETFEANSGGHKPSMSAWCYHDPNWATRYGEDGTDAVREAIITAHAAGQIINLFHTPGNPVTGALHGVGTDWPMDGAGGCWDQAGVGAGPPYSATAMSTIIPGGSNHAVFRSYVDRLCSFIDSLIDPITGLKIPVIYRNFFEIGGGGFWWNVSSAQWILMWEDMVGYMRDTKGITNVLYNVNCISPNAVLMPGANFWDVISFDYYDDSPTGASPA